MALIGLHVTQYMYVLFDKVHIYIQKSQFTLVRYVQKCIVSNKHPVDDLHLIALPGLHVRQQMFVLFDKVHHLCPNTSLFARLVQ